MKIRIHLLFALACIVLMLLAPGLLFARDAADEADKTASPYFFVEGDPALDRLPLKSTTVDANVAGVIADVRVTQRYKNEGQRPLEARYVFPGSTRAAVRGLQMRVGDRLVVAQIREKKQARAEYETARQEGKTASLLEQHRPNVFQMNLPTSCPATRSRWSCATPSCSFLPTASPAAASRYANGSTTLRVPRGPTPHLGTGPRYWDARAGPGWR
jgi:hypothetical protein